MPGLTVDGTASSLACLPAADVMSGTTLDFSLGSSAGTARGAAPADAPPSYGGTPGAGVKQAVGPLSESQTGPCADDRGAATSNGTAIQIYSCNGTGAQSCTGAAGQLWTLPSG